VGDLADVSQGTDLRTVVKSPSNVSIWNYHADRDQRLMISNSDLVTSEDGILYQQLRYVVDTSPG
jgi:hypothetical protein